MLFPSETLLAPLSHVQRDDDVRGRVLTSLPCHEQHADVQIEGSHQSVEESLRVVTPWGHGAHEVDLRDVLPVYLHHPVVVHVGVLYSSSGEFQIHPTVGVRPSEDNSTVQIKVVKPFEKEVSEGITIGIGDVGGEPYVNVSGAGTTEAITNQTPTHYEGAATRKNRLRHRPQEVQSLLQALRFRILWPLP